MAVIAAKGKDGEVLLSPTDSGRIAPPRSLPSRADRHRRRQARPATTGRPAPRTGLPLARRRVAGKASWMRSPQEGVSLIRPPRALLQPVQRHSVLPHQHAREVQRRIAA